jgi:hypothetical protein
MDEVGSLLHDFVENRGRVELRCEEPSSSGKLLRERACCALGLEELAPLERAARRIGEMARELEIILRENAFLLEEDTASSAR